jgi:hypothetical protein
LTHSYHKYPAKFIPQLAKALIQEYSNEGDFLWDPFCGSGTLNLEAYRNKRHSIGSDINPISILISRAKTRPLEPSSLNQYCDELIDAILRRKIRRKQYYLNKDILNGNYNILSNWYSIRSLKELAHIINMIHQMDYQKQYSDFSLCAFSSILKRSSFWLNSSVKGQIDPTKKPSRPLIYFQKQLELMKKANELLYLENRNNKTEIRIFRHNIKRNKKIIIPKIDSIITSPPYIVSYDYSDIFRLSTYFLYYQNDYIKYRREFIGSPLRKGINEDYYNSIYLNRINCICLAPFRAK